MNIKNSKIHNFGGFQLDIHKIGTASIDERAIKLPYTGALPEPYDAASIFMRVTPECVAAVLEVKTIKRKPAKYTLEASREDIDAILWQFFFGDVSEHTYYTRFNNGLSEYWNGYYMSEFMAWRSIGQSPTKIISIMQQLSSENRASLYRMIDHMRSEETTAG